MKLLLDSVILIDHFNGIERASRFLAQTHAEAAISVITRAEVLAGFTTGTVPKAARLLDRFPNLPIDAPTADLAAALRRAHGWKLPDAFQAAIAQRHGLRLATRNRRDFPPGQFAFVVIPYRV
ncbi:MAG: PIN domain-containing protein [Burkholderiales bacterium]|nr:PIN domain-containing protein [Burkholderiales bacterium]